VFMDAAHSLEKLSSTPYKISTPVKMFPLLQCQQTKQHADSKKDGDRKGKLQD